MTELSAALPRWRRFTPKQYATAAVVLIVLVATIVFYKHIDMEALHARAEATNGVLLFSIVTVLPLFGFPVSVLHAIVGARFGLGYGMVLVAVTIFLQMLASYGLVKAFPNLFARRLEPFRKRLPKGAHRSVTLFTLLLPGAPFFAQNYVLPLIGVPLRTFLCWGLPIHAIRSVIGVLFGDMSGNLTPLRLAGFGAYTVSVIVACAFAFRRLKKAMQGQPPKEDDPKPAA